MILRVETPISQEKKGRYDKLTKSAGTIPPTLEYSTWGPHLLLKKGRYYEFASAVRRNNIAFRSMTHRAKILDKKKILPQL